MTRLHISTDLTIFTPRPPGVSAESVSRSSEVTPRGPATPLTPAGQLEAAAAAPARPPTVGKKKKLDVKDVFNQDDDDGHQKKKRKLVPLGERPVGERGLGDRGRWTPPPTGQLGLLCPDLGLPFNRLVFTTISYTKLTIP